MIKITDTDPTKTTGVGGTTGLLNFATINKTKGKSMRRDIAIIGTIAGRITAGIKIAGGITTVITTHIHTGIINITITIRITDT